MDLAFCADANASDTTQRFGDFMDADDDRTKATMSETMVLIRIILAY
jgi:hypothetical protein